MHFVKVKGILSSRNSVNLYRGCTHGCIYCDSRSNCYQINHEFTDIEVKENAIELLETELIKKRNKIMVFTGSMTDPYLHYEKELEYTKKMLEVIYKYGHGVSILTKSDLILRDLDLLIKINKRARTVVAMTLTTFKEELCKIVEPYVATTKRRFEVLKTLNEHGIETVVWICPLLPMINDDLDNLKGILNYCKDAGVKKIVNFGMGLTLRQGNREYYYSKLDESFPGLKSVYKKKFNNDYEIPSDNTKILYEYFKKFCKENNIETNMKKIFQDVGVIENDKKYFKISVFDLD